VTVAAGAEAQKAPPFISSIETGNDLLDKAQVSYRNAPLMLGHSLGSKRPKFPTPPPTKCVLTSGAGR
jgi:hypothetical protein